jgi:tetratricopeptide (TPR) repeat protein
VGSRADNLREAIGLFEGALAVIAGDEAPVWWAELNYLMGSALLHCPKTPRGSAMPRAIGCFENALSVWTHTTWPGCWAAVQFAMGTAWERNPNGSLSENLERAIGCYHAALGVRTREASPVGWARLQSSLGSAWLVYPGGDTRQNCERAIAALTGALEIWARESRRSEWASAQMSLGTAWTIMPTGSVAERESNLERAVRCFRAALESRSRERCPVDWASTQHNLGNALLTLAQVHGPREVNAALVRQAIECFGLAHSVRTPERSPVDWAKTAAAAGSAYGVLPVKDRNAALARATRYLSRAIAVFEKTGDERHAAHARRLLERVRSGSDGEGDVGLTDLDSKSLPRRERKLAERGDGGE